MSSIVKRAFVTLITSLALISTTAGLQAATAAPAERSAPSSERAAGDCVAAKQATKKAKKKATKKKKAHKKANKAERKAKKNGTKKAKKKAIKKSNKATKSWKKAKKDVKKKQRAQKRQCAAEAQDERDNIVLEITNILESTVLAQLPPEVRDPLTAVLEGILGNLPEIPAGADIGQLEDLLAQFSALDPSGLAEALAGLSETFDPAQLTAILDLLTGAGLPGAPELPAGDLADMTAAFEALLAAFQGFDPSDPTSVLTGIVELIEGLVGELGGSGAPELGTFLELLEGLNGGALPTDPAAFADLLTAALSGGLDGGLPFELPTELGDLEDLFNMFGSLDALLGGEQSPTDLLDILEGLGVPSLIIDALALILGILVP